MLNCYTVYENAGISEMFTITGLYANNSIEGGVPAWTDGSIYVSNNQQSINAVVLSVLSFNREH